MRFPLWGLQDAQAVPVSQQGAPVVPERRPARLPRRGAGSGRHGGRAWRWASELEEAADTVRAAGLPDDVLRAVADTLRRCAPAKDDASLSPLEALDLLRDSA
ncbi:DUF1932 domain-containing protein [Kitasatospora sp. LaBMicrA B282]|uniref:DUF1932 domain-containing protein n=1 Tax=Kitasatospora sp. LaBMicrA B282 TaxID=3420949 RepID=UPI003D0C7710